jgi:stress response protein YsnF
LWNLPKTESQEKKAMARITKIEIPAPCNEDWAKMTPAEQGRHCALCQKKVTDFSAFTDKQIISFYEKPENVKACGRFRVGQLETLNENLTQPIAQNQHNFLRPIFATALLTAACSADGSKVKTDSPKTVEQVVEPRKTAIEADSTHFAIGKIAEENTAKTEVTSQQKPIKMEAFVTSESAMKTMEIQETRVVRESRQGTIIKEERHTAGVPMISTEALTRPPWRKRIFWKLKHMFKREK